MSDASGTWLAARIRRRPLTLADILDGMFELFARGWRAYVLAIGVVVVPVSFVTGYLTIEVFGGQGLLEQFDQTMTSTSALAETPQWRDVAAVVGLSVVVGVVVTPLLRGAAYRIAAEGYELRSVTAGQALRFALRRYPALVAVTVLVGIAAGLALVVPGVPLVAGIAGRSVGLIVIGSVLVLLVGFPLVVAVLVVFVFSYVCIVVEGTGPLAALRRSVQLVRGRFLRVLGISALSSIIAMTIAQLLALPLQAPGDSWGVWLGVLFTAIAGVIVSVLSTPLTANAITLLYFDTRIRTEAYDLQVLVDQLSAEAQPEQRIG